MRKPKSRYSNPAALLRGVISAVHATNITSDKRHKTQVIDERKKAQVFRGQMKEALLRSRTRVHPAKYPDFFKYVRNATRRESNRFANIAIDFDYLIGLSSPEVLSLVDEIVWVSNLIELHSEPIRKYLSDSRLVAQLVIVGEFDAALAVVNRCNLEHGYSLWGIELLIALKQQSEGTESQKQYSNDVRSLYKKGLLPYLVTSFSRRAEQGVSIGWFHDNTRRRIERTPYEEIRPYLKFRLLNEVPSSQFDVSSILRHEQNHHFIDIYETVIAILQHTAIYSTDEKLIDAVSATVRKLLKLGDYRLQKLAHFLKLETLVAANENAHATTNLFLGKPRSAFREFDRALKSTPDSIYLRIGRASASSILRSNKAKPSSEFREIAWQINAGIESMLLRNNSFEATVLRKAAHVFSGLHWGVSLQRLHDLQHANDMSTQLKAYWATSLSMTDFGLLTTPSKASVGWFPDAIAPGLTPDANALPSNASRVEIKAMPDVMRNFVTAAYHLQQGDPEAAEFAVRKFSIHDPRLVSANSAVLRLTAYGLSENISEASKLIAFEVAVMGTEPEMLPLDIVFDRLEWKDLAPFGSMIELGIALTCYSQVSANDRINSYRCFALQRLLRHKGLSKPSLLGENGSEFESRILSFFLGRGCSLSVLDMLPSITNSKDVLEERRDICAALVNLGGDNAQAYQEELVTLSRAIAVHRGLQTFDGSRVHVDTDALIVIAKRELNESFQRYLLLTQSGVESADKFDSILRDLTRKDYSAKNLLTIPESEADELLISMILRARERFLFDIPHGLDSYLSKRVRHGSIVGYLRAPAEKEDVITAQALDGSYALHLRWVSQLEVTTQRAQIANAFSSFAKGFDEHLLRLRNVLLHVKSESHPLGVFDAPLSGPSYHLLRAVAIRDKSIETFLGTIFASLWGLLNPSLHAAKELLQAETLRVVTKLFYLLRAKISAAGLSPQLFAEMDNAVGRASAAVQGQIEAVSAWFDPIAPGDCNFAMSEVVEIAAASVRAIRGSFYGSLSVECSGELLISGTEMPVIVDVLFVAFENVAKWSNMSGASQIVVRVWHSSGDETLCMRIENDVVVDNYELAQLSIEQRRKAIVSADGALARQEGGSGFAKISSIVSQSTKGTMDFGFSSRTKFYVMVELSTIAPGSEL